jgi:hypothetical protein
MRDGKVQQQQQQQQQQQVAALLADYRIHECRLRLEKSAGVGVSWLEGLM